MSSESQYLVAVRFASVRRVKRIVWIGILSPGPRAAFLEMKQEMKKAEVFMPGSVSTGR
jgi:hypothetical protein